MIDTGEVKEIIMVEQKRKVGGLQRPGGGGGGGRRCSYLATESQGFFT